MRRPALIGLGIGAACLAVLLVAALSGAAVMPSYLAAWLVVLAPPLGALSILMGVEFLPGGGLGIEPALRRFAALMPLVALLSVPVLFRAGSLFFPDGPPTSGFPAIWMTPSFLTLRGVAYLAVWSALGLAFSRPSKGDPRIALAGAGLVFHLIAGTLAVNDWVRAVDPGLRSSALGILVLAAQASLASALASLTTPRRDDGSLPRGLAPALLLPLALWIFLTFTQYLVVWSANLPAEVAWYQSRSAGVGRSFEILACLVSAFAVTALLFDDVCRRPGLVYVIALLLVALHAIEMLWFVTPASRGHFSITTVDLLSVFGLAALGWTAVGRKRIPDGSGRLSDGRA